MSIKTNYLLGVTKKLLKHNTVVKSGVVLDAPGMQVNAGTYCLVFSGKNRVKLHPKRSFDTFGVESDTAIHKDILIPFTSVRGGTPRRIINSSSHPIFVKEFEETDFLDTIKTIEIQRIKPTKFNEALNYVMNVGPLIFSVDDANNAKHAIQDLTTVLHDIFKESSIFYSRYSDYKTNSSYGKAKLVLTVIELSKCIPVFEPEHVNGVMLQIAVIYPEKSEAMGALVNNLEVTILFSERRDNLITTDGSNTGIKFCRYDTVIDHIAECFSFLKDIGEKSGHVFH